MAKKSNTTDSSVSKFEETIQAFEVTSFNFSNRFINDTQVRTTYVAKSRMISSDYYLKVKTGQISPLQGAREVNILRNEMMALARLRSSDIGRARAESLKAQGKTLEGLCEYYATKKHGKGFTALTKTQQSNVYMEIIKASGRTRTSTNINVKNLSKLGKGFIFLSLGISVYNIAAADNKVRAAGNEGVIIGGGMAGGAFGGAMAGLACGPGAPVCVTLGVFVGGIAGAEFSDRIFDWFY